jgi:lysophospholipid acyltransferase (LPLAT)-like uncharacterized protein
MLGVEKEPGGDLRNSLYRQRTRSSRRLTRTRLALYTLLVPVAIFIGRTIWRWCARIRVVGTEHVTAALERAGVKLGFLISPSVDGEIGAMLVRKVGAEVIRGSSSHTGARALRDYYQALAHEGISPAITPDGPRGPPWKFKPGAILLAQMSQRPMIPMAYAASRAWRIQWDRFVIPKPFARIAIVIGPPVYVPKGLDAPGLERIQAQMEQNLGALHRQAEALIT